MFKRSAREKLNRAIDSDTTNRLLAHHGTLHEAFRHWWLSDSERAKCTLEQAVGLYMQTFPARVLPLVLQLIEGVIPPEKRVSPWLT